MHVTRITTSEEFYQLRPAWEAIHAKDLNATAFQSWAWLCGWIDSTPDEWFVLAIQPDATGASAQAPQAGSAAPPRVSEHDRYVGFVALSRRAITKNGLGYKLLLAGTPFVDQASFVCLPESVDAAIPAVAAYIRDHIEWNIFQLRNVGDSRLDLFLTHLSSKRISVQEVTGTACPYILLPETWERYFKESIGSHYRKTLRNGQNRLKHLEGVHVTEIQRETADSHIDTLLSLWQARWGLKGEELYMGFRVEDVLKIKRAVFRRCFDDQRLCLDIFWDKATPMAGGVAFVDRGKKTWVSHLGAVNYAYAEVSPGIAENLYEIRHAIEQGFRYFDFGTGDEKYKYSLGAQKRYYRNVVVVRRGVIMALKDRLQVRTRLNRLKERLMGANVVNGTG